ncbi:MAG: aminotransferase class III-fold pyridoxal phosphate-dependent enzyme [bacterium]|nr:aminotransferase class III-fold pyridoxal phosphate-dependent enzyme [bacterium]
MARRSRSAPGSLADAPAVREAAAALLDAVAEEANSRVFDSAAYERAIKQLERLRGRPLGWPMLQAGVGQGAHLRLADGTRLLDFIGGIGVYAFGHSDRNLLETAVAAAAVDTVFQGHLVPGVENLALSKLLVKHAGPQLKHVWLSVSGAMANENALKMILQKHQPADRIIVFENAFAGRTLAMAELTDKPGFREGLPLRGNVLHVPFYDPSQPDPIRHGLDALETHLGRYPGRIAAMMFELVQGEGGFNTAPPEYFRALMERCRDAGIAIWVDEVQTFARTGELYAFRTLGLEDLVDVATLGKVLQGSAVLCRRRYNPKPGLISGTYAGSTVGLAVGARIIERLDDEGYLGPEGRVAVLARRVERRFELLGKRMPRAIGPRSGIGAMQAFVPWNGNPEVVGAVLRKCFEEGLLVFGAGRSPMKVRMLLPVNTTDEELELGFTILEKALAAVGEERGLPC